MRVTIPACEQHEGFFSMTVTISDYCPKCGGKRGVPYKGFSYDGSRRLVVDCWENSCGHVDKYSEVREEVRREATKDEIKNRISMALKDPILQQGFEIICKENAELKEKISYLEDNLRVARKDRENLQLDVARGLKEFVKDFPATSLRYLANEKYIEQLTKAKKIIKNLMVFAEMDSREYEKEYKEAEQFLKEAEE